MRISDSMFQARTLSALQDRQQDYLDAHAKATSGRKATRPSDDPIAMSRAHRFRSAASRAEGHRSASSQVESRLQIVDGAIGEVESLMARARELAVQGSNAALTASDRSALAAEVQQLNGHLQALAATKSGDAYLFSGTAESIPPFDASGTYVGSRGIQSVEVAAGVRVQLGVIGEDVFANPAGDAFAALDQLQTALQTDDVAGVQAALDAVGTAGDLVSETRSRVGVQLQTVDIANSVTSRAQYQAEESLNREIGADAFQAYTELTQAQSALSAAVQIAGQLPLPGLASR